MKNIFKKNQIIIVALAIMIIVAGYLNYSDRNKKDEANFAQSGEVLDYDTNGDTAKDNDLDSDLVTLADGENKEEANAEETKDEAGKEDGEEAVATANEGEDAEAAADISDADSEQMAVSDTGEVVAENEEDGAPGEAVLVSTTIPSNYFATAKLEREQLRAKNTAIYNDIINNVNATEENKAKAVDALINQTSMSEKEFKTEKLLQARGFNDAVVAIGDENVEVIINAVSISEQEVAQIQDIVTRNTEVDVAKVVIVPVVIEE